MAKKKTNKTQTVAAKPATDLKAQVKTSTQEDKEVVMTAEISFKSEECVLTNASQNTICLSDGEPTRTITVAPREIKKVPRDLLRELLKNKMVQCFFDKGILSHNMDAEEKTAHSAVVPEELKNPVERHEDGQNVVASVKKFEKEGSVQIDL